MLLRARRHVARCERRQGWATSWLYVLVMSILLHPQPLLEHPWESPRRRESPTGQLRGWSLLLGGSSCKAVPHPWVSGCCWQQFPCSSPASAASQCVQQPLETVKHLGWRCCHYGRSHALYFTLIYRWMSRFAADLCSDPSPNTSPSRLRWPVPGPMGHRESGGRGATLQWLLQGSLSELRPHRGALHLSRAGSAMGQRYGAAHCPDGRGLHHGAVTPQPQNTLQTWKATSGTRAHRDGDTSLPGGQVAGSGRAFGQAGWDERAGTKRCSQRDHPRHRLGFSPSLHLSRVSDADANTSSSLKHCRRDEPLLSHLSAAPAMQSASPLPE